MNHEIIEVYGDLTKATIDFSQVEAIYTAKHRKDAQDGSQGAPIYSIIINFKSGNYVRIGTCEYSAREQAYNKLVADWKEYVKEQERKKKWWKY